MLVDIPENDVEGEKGKSSETQCPALIMPPRTAAPADIKGSPSGRVPTCVPRWMRILRPILAYALNFRVAPSFSFANLLDDESSDDSAPSSPSQRSFADLPDTTTDGRLVSPPQSPLLSGQPLFALPGAEPDNTLILLRPPCRTHHLHAGVSLPIFRQPH
jgi:hypothetical protein